MSILFGNVSISNTTNGLGLSSRASVVAASTASTPFTSILSGATLDGITLATDDRILLKDQDAPEITQITFTAGATFAAAGTGNYLILYSALDATEYAFWFNVSGGNTAPVVPGATIVSTAITAANTAAQIATAFTVTISAYAADFGWDLLGAMVTITNMAPGQTTDASVASMPVGTTANITQQGVSSIDNGIYVVRVIAPPIRAADAADGNNLAASIYIVQQGTVNADTGWLCTSDTATGVVGTDALTFAQITGSITGPPVSTDNALVRWDGTSGKYIQNSGTILSDVGDMTNPGDIRITAADKYFRAFGTASDIMLGYDSVPGSFVLKQSAGVGGTLRFMTNSTTPTLILGATAGGNVASIDTPTSGSLRLQTTSAITTTILGNGGIFPQTANTPDIGATALRFRDAFMRRLFATDGVQITEAAANPIATTATTGTVWIKNDTPNILYYTNDAGTNHAITVLTTKGDLMTHDGSIEVPLPVGLDGQFLVVDSATSTGQRWAYGPAASQVITSTSFISTTKNSYVDLDDPMSITMDTGTMVQVSYQLPIANTEVNLIEMVRITDAGETITYSEVVHSNVTANTYESVGGSQIITGLTPGSNTFKIQWKTDAKTVESDGAVVPRWLCIMPLN